MAKRKQKSKRLRITVQPAKCWGWRAGGPGSMRGWFVMVDGLFHQAERSKRLATSAATSLQRELWNNHATPTELWIKGVDGKVEDARTYPRSSDPRRTRG